jgi:thiol-disulfide isomerase/thioredoxin
VPIAPGTPAPQIEGVTFGDGPVALLFWKDSCPVCQMVAPLSAAFEASVPGRLVGVSQDDAARTARFAERHGFAARSVLDPPPYAASDAYGVESVPLLVLVGADGVVADVSGAWDREAWNRIAASLAEAVGVPAFPVSEEGDGLPTYRPG